MLEAHGLLQLTMRSETARIQAQFIARNSSHNAATKPADDAAGSISTGSTGSSSSGTKSAITLPKGATTGPMKEFWQRAADKAAENAPSADTLKKLQDASKDDNKEIAAQKMQQAKSKLQSLRLQAQLAAASGDKQQLRRLAQEVAAAARDVASAAHDFAGSVVDSVSGDSASVPLTTTGGDGTSEGESGETGDTGAASGPSAEGSANPAGSTTGAAASPDTTHETAGRSPAAGNTEAGTPANPSTDNDPLGTALQAKATDKNAPLYAQDPPQDGDKFAWGQKALNSLSTDANNAMSQARGLLAFIATLVRGKRKSGEGNEDDRFFNELQRMVDDAQASVNHDISGASQELVADQTAAADASAGLGTGDGSSSQFGIESITMTTQVTTTAVFLNITT
ncbi:MAG TPA: hypothetical protein VN229_21835 [Terriglobales bacterium]|nr:hypothetical protein [Terriglobales bacterium]